MFAQQLIRSQSSACLNKCAVLDHFIRYSFFSFFLQISCIQCSPYLLASICACWMYSQHALGSSQRNTLICRRVRILGTFSNPSLTFGDRMQLFLLPFFPPFFERAADASRRTLPGLCGAVLSILWRRAASGAVVATAGLIEVTTSALSALCLRCQPARPKINCYAARQDRKMSAHVRALFAPPHPTPPPCLNGDKCSIADMYGGFWMPSQLRHQRHVGQLMMVCGVGRGHGGRWDLGLRRSPAASSVFKRFYPSARS